MEKIYVYTVRISSSQICILIYIRDLYLQYIYSPLWIFYSIGMARPIILFLPYTEYIWVLYQNTSFHFLMFGTTYK